MPPRKIDDELHRGVGLGIALLIIVLSGCGAMTCIVLAVLLSNPA